MMQHFCPNKVEQNKLILNSPVLKEDGKNCAQQYV